MYSQELQKPKIEVYIFKNYKGLSLFPFKQ